MNVILTGTTAVYRMRPIVGRTRNKIDMGSGMGLTVAKSSIHDTNGDTNS